MAGTLGGFTTTIITNPLDIVRARLQVQRLDSMLSAFRILWIEEGLHMFIKGLSARLVQSACFSFSIILGYETIKRVSITEEYKSYIRWWALKELLRLISDGIAHGFHPAIFYTTVALFNECYFLRIKEKIVTIQSTILSITKKYSVASTRIFKLIFFGYGDAIKLDFLVW